MDGEFTGDGEQTIIQCTDDVLKNCALEPVEFC